MSWEDVPHNPFEAHRRGWVLGDCPFDHGTEDGNAWRALWVSAEADHQDIRTNSLEAAMQVPPSTLPRARTEADALIDSFNEKVELPAAIQEQFCQALVRLMVGTRDATVSLRGFSALWHDEPKPPPVQWKWPDVVRPTPGIPVPRSATQVALRAKVQRSGGIQPRDQMRQILIEEQARLALRDRSKLRLCDLTTT